MAKCIKLSSTFKFEQEYKHWDIKIDPMQAAHVDLEIDYQNKCYSITPGCGTNDFQFRQSSHKKNQWIAVLNCIQEAIEFAEKELKKNES